MRHRLLASMTIATLALAALAAPAAAGQRPTRDNNCIHPSGVNINEVLGVPEQLAHPVCPGLTAGEHWRAVAIYTGAEAVDAIYPPGYTPLHAEPVDDFLSKLTIKVVVDGGTPWEMTYTFSAAEAARTDVRLHQINPALPDLPTAFVIPRMKPLSVGHHTHEMFLVMSALHCDGLSTVEAESCFPGAGEFSAFGVRDTDVAVP
jgi:hypothetical protein